MNSSTSNSRSEWKVIASVLAVLLIGEISLYFTENRLSYDVQHIGQIPAIVNDIKQGNSPRVLFLGNSLTRAGIRPDIVKRAWAGVNLPDATIGLIYPDDTVLTDWLYVYRRFVQPANTQLRLVIICFANDHLDDGPVRNSERLGSQFAGLSLAAEAFSHDVLSLSDRVRYLLGATSRLWANRERIQKRVLALIPGYQEFAPIINDVVRSDGQAAAHAKPPTYNQLARFLNIVTSDGTKVVFVATPVRQPYPLPDELYKAIRRGGAEIIDLRGFERTGPGDFLDSLHLAPAAAERFSKALGSALVGNDYAHTALWGTRLQGYRTEPSGSSTVGSGMAR
ncbi:hypothetical protein J2Y48_001689 [Mycoplana sp. BE70]|uniref:hypothetical protein n=1 Tax=Mycoplana sp. BE70 TaxID=2817775 RepID=UPI00285A7513|nr:hypothetical protein [Mycoplana sp. BE70]MDR6756399.1 hypothetical protein [Mycoplana sp. BE70]